MISPLRRSSMAALALLATLGAAACSGGSDSDAQAAPSVNGLTPQAIKIGISVADPAAARATFKTTGARGISTPDESGVVKAVVDYLNTQGGMAGRTVVPVLRVAKESDVSASMQADCAAFTQDNSVFAAYSTNSSAASISQLADCLAQHKSFFVFDTRAAFDKQDFAKWSPYVYAPAYIAADRWKGIVDNLVRLGYFDPGAKVGLVSIDEPSARRLVTDVVKPALAAHGITPTDVVSVGAFTDLAGISQVSKQVSSYATKFKNQHIDHVMFVGTYSAASYFFPAAAEGQNYHPRYALNSSEGPQALAVNAPKAQFRRAVGVGWLPTLDVDEAEDPKDNAAQTRCLDIVGKAGIVPGDRAAQYRTLGICDALFFLKAAVEKASSLTPDGIASAVQQLGTTFTPAKTHQTAFGSGRKDGVSQIRGFAFDDTCGCFRYTDKTWQPLP